MVFIVYFVLILQSWVPLLFAFNNSYYLFYYEYIENDDKNSIIGRSINYSELYTVLSFGFLMLSREVEKIIVPEELYIWIDLIPIFVSSIYCTFFIIF